MHGQGRERAADRDLERSRQRFAQVLLSILDRLGCSVGLLFLFHDVQLLVSLERLLEQHDLALTFDPLALGIVATLAIAFGLVELGHLVDTLLVLLFDLKLELELMQHTRDLGGGVRGIVLDQVEIGVVASSARAHAVHSRLPRLGTSSTVPSAWASAVGTLIDVLCIGTFGSAARTVVWPWRQWTSIVTARVDGRRRWIGRAEIGGAAVARVRAASTDGATSGGRDALSWVSWRSTPVGLSVRKPGVPLARRDLRLLSDSCKYEMLRCASRI